MEAHIHWHITRVATLSFLELTIHQNEKFVQTSNTFTYELWNTITSGLILKGPYVWAFISTNWPQSHYTHRASIFTLLLLLSHRHGLRCSLLPLPMATAEDLPSEQPTGDHSPQDSRQPRTILTFRHRASSILEQAFHYSPENAFYMFNQQIYFIIWYLLDRASLI